MAELRWLLDPKQNHLMNLLCGKALIFAHLHNEVAPVGNIAHIGATKEPCCKNLTIVGNTYVSSLVKGTLGVMFGGNWGGDNGASIFGSKGVLSNIVKYGPTGTGSKEINGFNKFMQVVGLGAAVYQLGTADAKTYVKETKVLKA